MDQLKKDISEFIVLESLNAQRIDRLNDNLLKLKDTIADSISQFTTSIAIQAQALSGFRELYAREIAFLHQSIDEVKSALADLKTITVRDKDKITEVEKDMAVARGSIKGVVMSWSGFVALVSFVLDKAIETFIRR